jgi:hypothetical protein
MVSTTHVVRRKNDGKYFKVVTHPILITELNSANPSDLKGEPTTMQTDIDVLLLNGYELVNGANRISSSDSSRGSSRGTRTSSRSRGRSNSYRSRGTGTTSTMSNMSNMSRTSKGGNPSRNLKYKNKTKKGKKCRY